MIPGGGGAWSSSCAVEMVRSSTASAASKQETHLCLFRLFCYRDQLKNHIKFILSSLLTKSPVGRKSFLQPPPLGIASSRMVHVEIGRHCRRLSQSLCAQFFTCVQLRFESVRDVRLNLSKVLVYHLWRIRH